MSEGQVETYNPFCFLFEDVAQMKEKLETYLDSLRTTGVIEPQVKLTAVGDGSYNVDVKLPNYRARSEHSSHPISFLLIRPRPGRMAKALLSVPEELRAHYVQVARKSMRGWYTHSHKGRKRRKHPFVKQLWIIQTGADQNLPI